MKCALVLFDRMTSLDFVGFYDALTRLRTMGFIEEMAWEFCAVASSVADDRGLRFLVDSVGQPLSGYDLLFVPGGQGTRKLQYESKFIDWLKTADSVPLKVSVCTGSLLLGAAGFLRGVRATTHPSAYRELAPYCAELSEERIVDSGNVITGRGVSSSLDLGLYVVEKLAGAEARSRIAAQMDYPYCPR